MAKRKVMEFREEIFKFGRQWWADVSSKTIWIHRSVRLSSDVYKTKREALAYLPRLRRAAFAAAKELGYEPKLEGEG